MKNGALGWVLVAFLVCPIGCAFGAEIGPVVVELAADGAQRATITLDSYSYTPNHLIVQHDKPVELALTSVTTLTPHNFILKEPSAGIEVEQDVRPGKTVTVRFKPTHPGTFTFYCDKKLLFFASHREKGMEGKMEVR
jgi:heme/copper-type cytochrome/quinol oxidase subunit 2